MDNFDKYDNNNYYNNDFNNTNNIDYPNNNIYGYIIFGTVIMIFCFQCFSKDICNKNKLKIIVNKELNELVLNNTFCSICYETYDDSKKICKLPCGHIYHLDCINVWFDRKRTCPYCNLYIK